MGRQIVNKPRQNPAPAAAIAAGQPTPDTFPEQILKLIPAEAVTLFVTLDNGLAAGIGGNPPAISQATAQVIFVILLIAGTAGTPVYLLKQDVKSAAQLILSTVAFLIWAFATSKSFALVFVPIPLIIFPFLIGFFTFFAPLFLPKQ